jgi:Cys-tRNA(Pro)/Cys-tRNA(Cys) deacylase
VTDFPVPAPQRLFDVALRKGVVLDVRPFPLAACTAEAAASALRVQAGQIVRTLVFVADRSQYRTIPIVCLVSGDDQVDVKLLAAVTGESVLRQAATYELRDLMGQAGSCTPPFGHGRDVRTVMDQELCNFEWVWVPIGSGPGVLRVEPRTLRMLANANVAPVTRGPRVLDLRPSVAETALQFEASSATGLSGFART